MSELTTRQLHGHPQEGADDSHASTLADALLTIAVLTTTVAVTVAWILALYWLTGSFLWAG